jgi:hypothetical protein
METLQELQLQKGILPILNNYYRIMDILLFVFGVFTFSFSIGSLSSLLSNLDSKQAKLKEKLNVLEQLKKDYNIPFVLYNKLSRALKYDHTK